LLKFLAGVPVMAAANALGMTPGECSIISSITPPAPLWDERLALPNTNRFRFMSGGD
jgi:hypothetical protein